MVGFKKGLSHYLGLGVLLLCYFGLSWKTNEGVFDLFNMVPGKFYIPFSGIAYYNFPVRGDGFWLYLTHSPVFINYLVFQPLLVVLSCLIILLYTKEKRYVFGYLILGSLIILNGLLAYFFSQNGIEPVTFQSIAIGSINIFKSPFLMLLILAVKKGQEEGLFHF